MKNVYLLLITLFISASSLYAQQTTFQMGMNFGTLTIPVLTDIAQTPTGAYLATGTTDVGFVLTGTLSKIDSAGDWVWTKEYVSTSGIETGFVDVKNVSAGGFIVAGTSDHGLFLMRMDTGANVIWANVYHIGGNTEENASRVLPTSDGGFVVAGYVYGATPPGQPTQDSANCYMLKVNSAGTLLWAKTVFCNVTFDNNHQFNDVAEDASGYVFAGIENQTAAYEGPTWGLVVKTDFNGNLIYTRHFGATGGSAATEATSIVSLNTTTQLIGGDDNNPFWIKFTSATGTGPGYIYSSLFPSINFNAVPTFDGNYALIGMYPLGFDTYLMKVNSSTGAWIWGERGFNGGFAALLPEGRQTADSGFVMVTTAEGVGGFEEFIAKTNSTGGTSATGCPASSTFHPTPATFNETFTAFTPDTLAGSTGTTMGYNVLNIHPTDSLYCSAVVCTAPPAPTTTTAAPATVCSGSPSTITASGSGSVTYEVFSTATGGTSLGSTPLAVSPTTTTTYYVEALNGPGCVSASRTPVTVTVLPVPGAVGAISGSAATCVGAQAYSISAVTNATTYAWSVSGGGSVTGGAGTTNVTVTWTTAGGPYTVSVTASNSCGSATNSLAVTVSGAPGALTASATPNPVCAGRGVVFSANSAGATSYSWSGPAGFSSTLQGPSITSILATQAGTYTVTASNTCGSVTATVSLVVNSDPTATTASASPNPVCTGQTVNLTGGATNATAWTWSGPSAYTSTLQSPSLTNVQANQSGIYTLIANNACGNDTAHVTLTVNASPTAVSASATPNPVCVGDTVRLTSTATGATTYSWTGPNSFTSTLQNPPVNGFLTADSGVYTFTATNTCGNSTGTVRVSIGTIPTAVTATSNTNLTCYNTTIELAGTASGATNYIWTGPNDFTSNHQNDTINNCIVADSGVYVLTVTNGCGSATSSVLVSIDTLIQNFGALARGGDTLCTGYQLALIGTGTDVNTWLWTGPNGFTSASQDTNVISAQLINNGQYILTATNACGVLYDTVNVFVEDGSILNLIATSSVAHDSACFGATINLMASDSFDSYNWTGPNGFVSFVQNPVITNASVSQSGEYYVLATNHCGQRSDSVHIYIDTIPQNLQLTTSSNNNSSCQGQSITVTAASPGISNWAWTGPANFVSNQASFTLTNVQPNQQGNYVVTATNSCGTANDTIAVTVFPLPDSVLVHHSADSICPGLSVTLSAVAGLTNIVWSNNQTGASISVTQPGTYYYTGQDANSCSVNSDSIKVYNAAPPTLDLFGANPTSICEGQQTVILRASSDVSETFAWSPGGSTADTLVVTSPGIYGVVAEKNGCFAGDTVDVAFATIPILSFTDTAINTCCQNVEFTPMVTGNVATYQWSDTTSNSSDLLSHTGTYTVTVTSNKGCTVSGSINFNKVCISATATANPDTVLLEGSGGSSRLNVTTLLAGNFSYQWLPADSVPNPTSTSPVVSPVQTTTYSVVVFDTVSGCTDTASVQVNVVYQYNFAIPNVFTPNNPGHNDTWYVINQAGLVTVVDMKVFDRWGEEVFDSQRDGTLAWNGKYMGKLQVMGNYVYMVQVKINATGEVKTVRGNLALLW